MDFFCFFFNRVYCGCRSVGIPFFLKKKIVFFFGGGVQ